MLKVGDKAPSFELVDHRGQTVRSDDVLGKGPMVFYFYPKDFTPGCTQEACLFRDAFDELGGLGATIIGVSSDDDDSHRKFSDRYQIQFSLVADTDRKLAKQWGITRPLGLGTRRVTYVIDRSGTIRGAFHHEISMSKHVADVRALLAELSSSSSSTSAQAH